MTRFTDEFLTVFHNFVSRGVFDKYFFIHGGGLAVENALKISFDWKRHINEKRGYRVDPETLKVMALEDGFHGITGYGLSLSTNSLKCSGYPKFDWPKFRVPFVHFPSDEVDHSAVRNAEDQALENIRGYIKRTGKQFIASMIIELVQGGGGDNHLGKGLVKALLDICEENDILLIVDECQTGFGVSGRLWCFEHYQVRPHLITFGKKAQVCGVGIGSHIPDVDEVLNVPGRMSPTWNGDITDYIRCKYIIKAYEEHDLIGNAERMGRYLISSLEQMQKFINVRGRGHLIAFDIENSKDRDRYDALCFEKGLFLLPMRDTTLRMRPNMALTQDEADHALNILDEINRSF